MFAPAAESVSPDDRVVFPIGDSPSSRRRVLEFLGLEHPVLPRFLEVVPDLGRRAAAFRRREGTPLGVVRQSRETAAALFVQAASAILFFASRGYPLELADFEDALVEVWSGAPHLWLSRPPRSMAVEPMGNDVPAVLLAGLLPRLFGRSSRGTLRIEPSARRLLDRYLEPFARPGRPDAALVEIFRAFPFLTEPPFASVRRRCIGFRPHGFDAAERLHRAKVVAADRTLAGRRPWIFHPGRSALLPFEALRASLGLGEKERDPVRIRRELDTRAETDTDWIPVDLGEWDDASIGLFENTAARRTLEVEGQPARPAARPDELRDAVWIAAPDLGASVAVYEALGSVLARNPGRLRATVSRFVSSPEYGTFLARGTLSDSIREADAASAVRELEAMPREERRAIGIFLAHPAGPTREELERVGAAPAFGSVAGRLAGGGWLTEDPAAARWRVADPSARADLLSGFTDEDRRAFASEWLSAVDDPLWRCLLAIEAGRGDVVDTESRRLFGEAPAARRPWGFDALIETAAAAFGARAPAPIRYYHADRLAELGLADEAKSLWTALAEDGASPASWRRHTLARLARLSEAEGDFRGASGTLARIIGDADAKPDELSASRRALARIAAGQGRFEAADALLSLAEADARVSDEERLELVLARAAFYGLRGEGDRESEVYEAHRAAVRRSSEETQFRFLLGEGTALSVRRDHRAAAVRFAEAVAAARDPEQRGAALIDLSVETFLLGDPEKAENELREAASGLRAAGNLPLWRTAVANLVNLLLERDRDGEAEPLIDRLRAESERQGDVKGRMLALAYRSRVALRRGKFRESAADRREALALCEKLGEKIERQELEVDESDARLFAGDVEGALAFARRAAGRADFAGCRESAALRAADLQRWRDDGATGAETFAESFETEPTAAAERIARARAFFGSAFESSQPALVSRARDVLRRSGREGMAEAIFSILPAVDAPRWRSLREQITANASPLRVVDGGGAVLWAAPAFERAAWTRPLAWGDPPLFVEGAGPDPDLAAFLFETIRNRGDLAAPDAAADRGIAVLRASGVITADRAMDALGIRLSRIAPQNVTVFVSGESGTGKERIARAVHRLSPRAEKAFVPINVAAFPEPLLEDELFGHARGAFTGADRDRVGLFETAHQGTLFLDEIGDLSPALQAKLLRVLQEREIKRIGENRYRPVDVRLVSATAKPLERAVEAGTFREDLYYRIKVATLHLPPLRDRGGDVAILARHFLARYSAEYGKGTVKLTGAAAAAFRAFSWPGNVRQLENAIMEAVALADAEATLDREAFPYLQPASDDARGTYRDRVDAFRRRTVAEALARCSGNRTHAARELGLTRQALIYLIRELGVRG